MSEQFDAIYEHGILRPLTPLNLPEAAEVTVIVQAKTPQPNGSSADPLLGLMADEPEVMGEIIEEAMITRQREALAIVRSKMDALPSSAPQDGLGGADHDQILYGWQK
jgi:predicted DNA-binding antitoxin AbrB/MazE fold protein